MTHCDAGRPQIVIPAKAGIQPEFLLPLFKEIRSVVWVKVGRMPPEGVRGRLLKSGMMI